MSAELLAAEALALSLLSASVVDANDIGAFAIEYGVNNWGIFPLNGKVPAIAGGRGVLDATTNTAKIAGWWGGRYAGCNIGGRVPRDVNLKWPRCDGLKWLQCIGWSARGEGVAGVGEPVGGAAGFDDLSGEGQSIDNRST